MSKAVLIGALCCLLALCIGARAEEKPVTVHVSRLEAQTIEVMSLDGRIVTGRFLGTLQRKDEGVQFCGGQIVGVPRDLAAEAGPSSGLRLWDPGTQELRVLNTGRHAWRIHSCSRGREIILLQRPDTPEFAYIHRERVWRELGEQGYGDVWWMADAPDALAWRPIGPEVGSTLNTDLPGGSHIYDADVLSDYLVRDWNPQPRWLLLQRWDWRGRKEEAIGDFVLFEVKGDGPTALRSGAARLRSGELLRTEKGTSVRSTLDGTYYLSLPRDGVGFSNQDQYRCSLSLVPGFLFDCERSAVFADNCIPDSPRQNNAGSYNSERYAIVYCRLGDAAWAVDLYLLDRLTGRVSRTGFRARDYWSASVSGRYLAAALDVLFGEVLFRIEDDWFQ